MNSLPTTVKIGWCDYKIVEWDAREASAARRFGETCSITKIIRIDVIHGPPQTAETLLHEIMHAIYSIWTIGKDDDEERIVTLSTGGLATVMRDNASVFGWIMENLA